MGNELQPLTPDIGYEPGAGLEGLDDDKLNEAALAVADVGERAGAETPGEIPQQGGSDPSGAHTPEPAGSTPAPATNDLLGMSPDMSEVPGIPEAPPPPALTGDPQKDVAANLVYHQALTQHRQDLLGHQERLNKQVAVVTADRAAKEAEAERQAAAKRDEERQAFAARRAERQAAIDEAVKAKTAAARDVEGADWMQRNTGTAIFAAIAGAIGQGLANVSAAQLGQVGHAENEGIKTINFLMDREEKQRRARVAQANESLLQVKYGFKDAQDNHRAAMNDLDADMAAKYRLIAKEAEAKLRQNGADAAAIQGSLLRNEALSKAAEYDGKIHDREETHEDSRANAKALQGIARANLGERRSEFRSREEDRKAAAADKVAAKKQAEADKLEARTVRDPDTGKAILYAPTARVVDKIADGISKTNMYVDAVNKLADHIEKNNRIMDLSDSPYTDLGKERAQLAADVQAMGRGVKGIQASDAGQKLEHQIIGGTGIGIQPMANPKTLRHLAEQARKASVQHLTSMGTPVEGETKAKVPSGMEAKPEGKRVRLKNGDVGTLAPDGTFTPEK